MKGFGKAGELIDVKPGFARNKLIPNGFALRASKKNIALIEEKKKLLETSKMREDASLQELLKQISKTEITIEAQVGEEEKMFGSITSNDIHKSLEEKGIMIDRNSILLESPFKIFGDFSCKNSIVKRS